jgi:hypothetical protein
LLENTQSEVGIEYLFLLVVDAVTP